MKVILGVMRRILPMSAPYLIIADTSRGIHPSFPVNDESQLCLFVSLDSSFLMDAPKM